MKATLEFTLPADNEDHRLALQGSSWRNTLWTLDKWLQDAEKTGIKTVEIGAARNKMYEILTSKKLSF